MNSPRVCLVSPASAADNNGNWHTALRWRDHLAATAQVELVQAWQAQDADVLIALHARRSAASIEAFHKAYPERPIVVVLTGTDVYRDLAIDAGARHSLALARHLVCLQPRALEKLEAPERAKACVIVQGTEAMHRGTRAGRPPGFVAVGHLRAEKDPLTLMRAARHLREEAERIEILHIGAGLDETLAAVAQATMRDCPGYRWIGPLPHAQARRHIADATALVHMSRIEGGANVVIEAIACATPVLASEIDGNLGLLGRDYEGYFPAGDAEALASLMRRCSSDAVFANALAARCAALAPLYTIEAEGEAVRRLLDECLKPLG